MSDAAKEDAYESLRMRLKDMSKALIIVKGAAAVQRSKRAKAEAQLDGVVESMKKMAEEIRCS